MYRHATEQAIRRMRRQLPAALPVGELAAEAGFSPYHFIRLFGEVTGVSPGRFYGALRLELARHLLLTTNRSVADICYDVGYSSPATFTRRFSRDVGVSPARLRDRCDPGAELLAGCLRGSRDGCWRGRVGGHDGRGVVVVGVFPTALASARPIACALADASGEFWLPEVARPRFFVLALAIRPGGDPWEPLRAGPAAGVPAARLRVRPPVRETVGMRLRRPVTTDPPILTALPFLLLPHIPRQIAR